MIQTSLHILYTDEDDIVWMEDSNGKSYDFPRVYQFKDYMFSIDESCDMMFVVVDDEDENKLSFYMKNVENKVLVLVCYLNDDGYVIEESYILDVVKTPTTH